MAARMGARRLTEMNTPPVYRPTELNSLVYGLHNVAQCVNRETHDARTVLALPLASRAPCACSRFVRFSYESRAVSLRCIM